MADLAKQLETAIDRLAIGAGVNNLSSLLTQARNHILQQKVERKIAASDNTSAMWEAHQLFTKRLSTILTQKLEVEEVQPGERLQWCYVTDFYATPNGRSEDPEPTITIRHADIRIETDEDKAPEHSRLQYSDRYGCEYREPKADMWTFPERWLWEDNWQDEFKRRSLEVRLRMTQFDRQRTIERRDELKTKTVPNYEAEVLTLTSKCEKLAKEMRAMGMDVPQDDRD